MTSKPEPTTPERHGVQGHTHSSTVPTHLPATNPGFTIWTPLPDTAIHLGRLRAHAPSDDPSAGVWYDLHLIASLSDKDNQQYAAPALHLVWFARTRSLALVARDRVLANRIPEGEGRGERPGDGPGTARATVNWASSPLVLPGGLREYTTVDDAPISRPFVCG